jgi:hypothetical protein
MRTQKRAILYSALASFTILGLLFLAVPGASAVGKAVNTLSASPGDFTYTVNPPRVQVGSNTVLPKQCPTAQAVA